MSHSPSVRDKQIATEGTPLEIEFNTGRLPPHLRPYADQFERAYEIANKPVDAVHAISWLDTSNEHPTTWLQDAVEVDSTTGKKILQGYSVEKYSTSSQGVHRIARQLITRLAPGTPVAAVDRSPAPDRLTGSEIRVHAFQTCQLLKFRCGRLYRPVVDAAVFAKTMREIGMGFGGNANDAPKIGREKVRDGLEFVKQTFDDLVKWSDEDGANLKRTRIAPRFAKALNADLPADILQAANDNLRAIKDVS